jgi:hypothetical protein
VYTGRHNENDLSFSGILIHLYGIWAIVHLWDFLIIDCGAILLIDPKNPPIAGTENAKGWKDVGFHFRALLLALRMSILFVLPVAGILCLIL